MSIPLEKNIKKTYGYTIGPALSITGTLWAAVGRECLLKACFSIYWIVPEYHFEDFNFFVYEINFRLSTFFTHESFHLEHTGFIFLHPREINPLIIDGACHTLTTRRYPTKDSLAITCPVHTHTWSCLLNSFKQIYFFLCIAIFENVVEHRSQYDVHNALYCIHISLF